MLINSWMEKKQIHAMPKGIGAKRTSLEFELGFVIQLSAPISVTLTAHANYIQMFNTLDFAQGHLLWRTDSREDASTITTILISSRLGLTVFLQHFFLSLKLIHHHAVTLYLERLLSLVLCKDY